MNKHLLLILLGFGLIGCATSPNNNITILSDETIHEMTMARRQSAEESDRKTEEEFARIRNMSNEEKKRLMSEVRSERLKYEEALKLEEANKEIEEAQTIADRKAAELRVANMKREAEERKLEEKRLAEERVLRIEKERKQKIIAELSKRCEGYGFTGETNIAACIQREAQHDRELAMQKYELQKTRLALQKAQSNNYAQTYAEPIQEDDDLPFLIKFLGEVAVEVAENLSDPTYIQLQKQQQQINQLKANQNRNIYINCRPNC